MKIIYTKHAEEILKFRDIDKLLVEKCIRKPDRVLPAREGKKIYLKHFKNNYLKAVVVEKEKYIIIITTHWLAKRRLKD